MAKQKQPQQSESNLTQEENSKQPQQSEDYFYGNKDTEEKYKLPNDWKSSVCVRQCKVEILNGGMVEVPNTHQLQTYDPKTYDKLANGDEKSGIPPFFSESKMKVTVLHDPREE